MNRRQFVQTAALAAGGQTAARAQTEKSISADSLPKRGPKAVVSGKKSVASSSHPLVTDTMLDVLKDGGNAMDAAIAGALMSATVEPHMTNHGGAVACLYWDSKTDKAYQLESVGTLVPGMAPFRPLPTGFGGFAAPVGRPSAAACIPGFMPGLGALHQRFGSKPWSQLCQSAIHWADQGHPVSSFEYSVLDNDAAITYFPAGRELFTPNGFLPQAGEPFRNPKLAQTLRRLAAEGPEYFSKGEWARHFVEHANALGWPIKLSHMTAIPPRWIQPLRYTFREHEILQLAPPERVGLMSAFFLGIVEQLNLRSMGDYTKSAETLYLMAHALRWVNWESGMLNDPEIFGVATDQWTSKDRQRAVADILKRSQPRIDLSEHVRLLSGRPGMEAIGLAPSQKPKESAGSCELSVADRHGNWVQLLNTMQSGGIPGAVVDGVPMAGTHAMTTMNSPISGFYGGGRIGFITGSTMVLKDGKPRLAFGTPGSPHLTVPVVLANLLEFGLDPYKAADAPRFWPLRDDYVLEIENRISPSIIAGLAKLGIQVKPTAMNEFHFGSFQMCWRDDKTGLLGSSADPRRCGKAGGI